MTDTQKVLQKLLQDHIGEGNAITQTQLSGALGLNPSTLRSELRRLREEQNIPIANERDGYYVISNREELQSFVGHINSEIESKKKTIEYTLEAYEEFDRNDHIETKSGGCERCGGTISGDPFLWYSAELCRQCYDDKPTLREEFNKWLSEGQG